MFTFCKCHLWQYMSWEHPGIKLRSDISFTVLVGGLKRTMMKWIGGSPSHSWWCLSSRKECYPESSPIHCNPLQYTVFFSLQCTIIPFYCTVMYVYQIAELNAMCDYELHYIAMSYWTPQTRQRSMKVYDSSLFIFVPHICNGRRG